MMSKTVPVKGSYQIGEVVVFYYDHETLEGSINSITKVGDEVRLEIKVTRTRFVRISASQIIPEY